MLRWLDILKYANNGNPEPPKRVEHSAEEWKELLDEETYRITREKGTEKPYASDMCSLFEAGRYECASCGTALFDAEEKFDSGSGWPSFTQPLSNDLIAYHKDRGHGMYRIESVCNVCDAHLGHVFQDGPAPSFLRFCINGSVLKKVESDLRKLTIGGGCFWCTEAIFKSLEGVIDVQSGYAGGRGVNPTYREVSSGLTGHAEVINITYDKSKISYKDLLRIHLSTHNPTTINKQGADRGTQYRSIILFRNAEEQSAGIKILEEMQELFEDMIVTELKAFESFYLAEPYHQDYYLSNPEKPYCQNVIEPKLVKLRKAFVSRIKSNN